MPESITQYLSNKSHLSSVCRAVVMVAYQFHYVYKASININFLINNNSKLTCNWFVYKFCLIYNITVFIFIQNFITCKISYYYFNSKVSPFLNFNISLVQQNNKALCLYSGHLNSSVSVLNVPNLQLNSEEMKQQYEIQYFDTCSQEKQQQTAQLLM